MIQQQQKSTQMEDSPCAKEIAGFTATAAATAAGAANKRVLRKDCRERYQKGTGGSKGLSEHNRHINSLNYWKCIYADQFSEALPPAREEYFVRIRKAQPANRKEGTAAAALPTSSGPATKKGVDISAGKPPPTTTTTTFLQKLSPIHNIPQHNHHHFLHRQTIAPFLHSVQGLAPKASATTTVIACGLRSPPTSTHRMDLRRHAPAPAATVAVEEEGENDYPPSGGKSGAAVEDEEDDLIFPIEI